MPTFRDAQTGLWARYRAEELASEAGFTANPDLVWSWYRQRREAVERAQPNAAHRVLAQLEEDKSLSLVTQNVDGLHRRAGSRDVVELHGNIHRAKCLSGCGWNGEAKGLESGLSTHCPKCPSCGSFARPDVVWFGEMLAEKNWMKATSAMEACDLCVVIGTSALVQPAAALPLLARARGARILVINPDVTELDTVAELSLHAPAAEILPRLVA